ncbi:MAG TPA: hypothetical protein VGL99_25075 [Chloroflexota bacterium]|jgi:hypothetical protein
MTSTLDDLLAGWASRNALTETEIERVRAAALGLSAAKVGELDVDWLRGLLRPVTALLDGPHRLQDTLMRPYTRLA